MGSWVAKKNMRSSPMRDVLSEPLSPFLKSDTFPEVDWTQEEEVWEPG